VHAGPELVDARVVDVVRAFDEAVAEVGVVLLDVGAVGTNVVVVVGRLFAADRD
jgi:hypothetical protein